MTFASEKNVNSLSFSVNPSPLCIQGLVRLTIREVIQAYGKIQSGMGRAGRPQDLEQGSFSVKWRDEEGDQQHTLKLTSQPCFFGGARLWFRCPRCGCRAYSLYWHRGFACRRCAGLRYVSQYVSADGRLWPHYDRLATQLRHRPGPKAVRFFRYAIRAEWHLTRDLARGVRRLAG